MSRSSLAREREQQPAAQYNFAGVTSPQRVAQLQALLLHVSQPLWLRVISPALRVAYGEISLCKLTAEPVQVLPHRKGLEGSPCVRKAERICIANGNISIGKKWLQSPFCKQ